LHVVIVGASDLLTYVQHGAKFTLAVAHKNTFATQNFISKKVPKWDCYDFVALSIENFEMALHKAKEFHSTIF
jgi:hypothetical protein